MRRRIVRYAIIALFTAIGLTFMGLADQIVMMAFGLILGSAAVATALAFGLGGRDAAARVARALGRPAGRPRRPAPPKRLRGTPPIGRPAAAGVTDDLRGGGRLRADAARHRAGCELWQAGGEGRIQWASFLFPSHEADTSFGVAIDLDTIEILKATDPDTFWQTRALRRMGRRCSSATTARTRNVYAK